MPSLLEEIADALARDVIRASQELKNDELVNEISKVIGASSPTTQEAFLTAVRVRQAEGRARKALAEKLGKSSWAEVVASRDPAEGRVGPLAPSQVSLAPPPPALPLEQPAALVAAVAPVIPSPTVVAEAEVSIALPAGGTGSAITTHDQPSSPATLNDPEPELAQVPIAEVSDRSLSVALPVEEAAPEAPLPAPTPMPRRVAPRRPFGGTRPPSPLVGPHSLPLPVESAPLSSTKDVSLEPDLSSPLPSTPMVGAPIETASATAQAAEPQPSTGSSSRDVEVEASPLLVEAPSDTVSAEVGQPAPVDPEQLVSDPEDLVLAPVSVAQAESPTGPERPGAEVALPVEEPATTETERSPTPLQHPPGSLAEALARAAAMPKPKIAPMEPKKPVVNPYADIEMPDGDWG